MSTPSTLYNRLKKHRQLKRFTENSIPSNDSTDVELVNANFSESVALEVDQSCNQHVENICPNYNDTYDHSFNSADIEDGYLTDSSLYKRSSDFSSMDNKSHLSSSSTSNSERNSHEENNDEVSVIPNLREKLQGWAVRFRCNFTVETIDGLLDILRSENAGKLPKSEVTLLKTKTDKNIKLMMSSKNTNGSYVYFDMEQSLKKIINNEFINNTIRLFNIDGLPLYNS